jgi:inhibitor of cysteine peptidase
MRRIIPIIVLVITSALMLTACKGKTIKINGEDNGSTISMKQGETLVLSIDGNPTTGYNWEIDSVDQLILQPVGDADYSTDFRLRPGLTGVGGTFKFTFTALNPGTTDLKLKYWRSFEPENPPVETFEVNVTVK